MAGEIDPMGTRKDGLDAFLDEKLAEGFAIETRTDTHAIIFRRAKRLRRRAEAVLIAPRTRGGRGRP